MALNQTSTPVTVLVAEDDRDMLEMLDQALRDDGYRVIGASDGDEALAHLKAGDFDIVLTDLKMPKASGLDILRAARARYLHQPVVMMTAFGTIDSAVEAMREGAYSYITKPFDLDDLLGMLRGIAEQVRLRRQSEQFGTPDSASETPFSIVYRSAAFREVMNLVQDVAGSIASVLIVGETGTGKELVAKELHLRGPRRNGPFVALDVNAIPETLLEAELFGHVRGAFTGAERDRVGLVEQANGGTLFLDEVGEISLPVQARLLRFLQERRYRRVGESQERAVDVRLVAATNRDLGAMIRSGEFREDLFYRLSVIQVKIPPLRERREDIPALAYHFLRKHNRDYRVEGFRPDVLDLLIDTDWPGNVRQLESAIEHAVVLRKAGLIQLRDLPEWIRESAPMQPQDIRSLEMVEKAHILRLLEECNGNRSRAARILGINRRTLTRKLHLYGVTDADMDEDDDG